MGEESNRDPRETKGGSAEAMEDCEVEAIGTICGFEYTVMNRMNTMDVYGFPGQEAYYGINGGLFAVGADASNEVSRIEMRHNITNGNIYHVKDSTVQIKYDVENTTILMITNPDPEKRDQTVKKLDGMKNNGS